MGSGCAVSIIPTACSNRPERHFKATAERFEFRVFSVPPSIFRFLSFRFQLGSGLVSGLGGGYAVCKTISHGGSRDGLLLSEPLEPSAKPFRDSDRRESPNSAVVVVAPPKIFHQRSFLASRRQTSCRKPMVCATFSPCFRNFGE